MKKVIYFTGIIITFFIIAYILVDNSKEDSAKVFGVVKSISEGGVNDLVFELENDKITYYINRGLENGFNLEKAKADYIGKKAIINYAKSWTILAPFGTSSKHIVQITIDDVIIYSEWK